MPAVPRAEPPVKAAMASSAAAAAGMGIKAAAKPASPRALHYDALSSWFSPRLAGRAILSALKDMQPHLRSAARLEWGAHRLWCFAGIGVT